MNAKMKKRLCIVTGVIVIVVVALAVFVGGQSTANTLSVRQVTSGQGVSAGQKVQVSGNVVDGSYSTVDGVLIFEISDADDAGAGALTVRYGGAAPSTFGNGVTAICTGKIADDGALEATELVTKCPSKYESAASASESADTAATDVALEG